jgi:two-component system sensor histidine kinase KdpD
VELLRQREAQGSTFLKEDLALPHARVEGLMKPLVTLGLTHQGILDTPTLNKIKIVFLLLSPNQESSIHLQLLATAAKIFQHHELRRNLEKVQNAEEALEVIQTWEYNHRLSIG